MTMREAFEQWVQQTGAFTDWSRYGDGYAKPLVDRTWQAWCAAVEWARADGESESARRRNVVDPTPLPVVRVERLPPTLKDISALADRLLKYADEWHYTESTADESEPVCADLRMAAYALRNFIMAAHNPD